MASKSKSTTAKKTATKQSSTNADKPKKKMGRPQIKIDKQQFEKFCSYMCTLEEIAGLFNCSEDTIERWCKRTYDLTFADAFKKYSADGKMSLRRKQFALAETSASMAIWLGKNYLGQTDRVENKIEFEDDGFIAALKGQANDTFKNAGDVVET